MNRGAWRWLLMGWMAAPLCAGAQTGFEGAVSMMMHAKGQSIPVDYEVKGHKARLEMRTQLRTNVVLIDLDAHTQTILIPELKAYAVHTGKSPGALSTTAPPKVTDLGTKETVAGHVCEDFSLESAKYSGTACLTKDFGDNPMADAMNGQFGDALTGSDELKKAGMPLKLTLNFTDEGKKGDTATAEVTKISPGAVDETKFEIPAGWRALTDLPQ